MIRKDAKGMSKKSWKAWFGRFVPKYIPNSLVAGAMGLLSVLHRTSKKQSEANRVHNQEVLVEQVDTPQTKRFFKPGTFIENQRQWADVRFGSAFTMAYGGCEIFAVYNALVALGRELTGADLAELIGQFERKGAVWAGRLGVAPMAAYKYFRKQGYRVQRLSCRKEKKINALGEQYDTIIVTAYNNGNDIFGRIHTVNISKDEEGRFWGHNCYKQYWPEKGGPVFVSDGPHATLWEAIHSMGGGKAEPICVIGIGKEKEAL